jgi:geranyl-CoA carboxylase beta subunit
MCAEDGMIFETKVDRHSPDFEVNRDGMLAAIARLRELEGRAGFASEKRTPRFEERGQITPRERLARLLDPGMPFLRLHGLAGYLSDSKDEATSIPGATFISGIGFVSGARVMVLADDSGINAGAIGPFALPALLSLQEIALRQKLPFIHLVESAGANLMNYVVEDWALGGAVFRNFARLSAAGLPTIAVLHGPSTAGGAYMPGMSDYVIGVKKNGMAALAGPALVYAATGEVATDADLGGAEMHASVSGLVEYLAEDDIHAMVLARELMARLDWNKSCAKARMRHYLPPRLDAEDFAGLVPMDYRIPYDMREVAARLLDGSDFSQFKPDYGPATICLQGAIHGIGVGVIGNNGPIDPSGATKAAQFIQACDQSEIPLIFLNPDNS